MAQYQTPAGPSSGSMHALHDFGEGSGVDMRDFNLHEKDDMDHELATPQLQTSGGMSSMPPTSIMTANGGPTTTEDMFQAETGMDDDDDDDDEAPKKRTKASGVAGGFTVDNEAGRRKIRIEYINDKSRRHITFSKRKAGIMKKAYELSILTGTQILLLVVSETGLVYTFTTTKLQPLVQKSDGKNLIQACLNAPDNMGPDGQPANGSSAPAKGKNGGLSIRPHKLTTAAAAALAAQQGADTDGAGADSQNGPADSQASLGVLSSTTPNRPKKRLPSMKAKKAAATSPSDIPPVPGMPNSSPPGSQGQLGMALGSPLTTQFSYPASHHSHDFGHGHHAHGPNPGQPGFYPPAYNAYAYPSSGYMDPAGLQSPYRGPQHHAQHSSPAHGHM